MEGARVQAQGGGTGGNPGLGLSDTRSQYFGNFGGENLAVD